MIPKFPDFKKIELSDREDILSFTSKYEPYSDFNFISLWCWNIKEETALSELNGNLVVRFNDYITGEPFYSFLGNSKVDDTVSKLLHLSNNDLNKQKLKLVPEIDIKDLSTTSFSVEEDKDNSDYLYDMKLLSSYHGGSMETKRNLVNRFLRYKPKASSKLIDLSDHKIQKDIFELIDTWERNKITLHKLVEKENESIALKRLFYLNNFHDLIGVGIFDGDSLIGFSINEVLQEPFAITHFAKSDASYPGVYSFLMKETCRQIMCYNRSVLNYEQDLGLPNLRFSKLSFRPINFFKKYAIYSKK